MNHRLEGWGHRCLGGARRLGGALFALAGVVLAIAGCARRPEAVELTYFYEALCPACPESAHSELLAGEVLLLGRVHDHVTAESRDVMHGDGMEHLRATAARHGVDPRSLTLPVLFVNDEPHVGFDAIQDYLDTW